jgi:putative redox protein
MTIAAAIRPKNTSVTFKLNSSGTGATQTIIAEGSPHVINVDARRRFGGNDEYPSPISYVLSSLISCSQVTAQLVADDLGILLHSFEFNLKAKLDTAIFFDGAAEGNPNFQDIIINARIETNTSDDLFEKLKIETERRCPVYQLFSRSGVNIRSQWVRQAS